MGGKVKEGQTCQQQVRKISNLSQRIEQYLKQLLNLSARGIISIQRKELANKFQCVPSQVNYVLSTRFGTDKGYLVESRRGGGGFIRISRIDPEKFSSISQVMDHLKDESLDKVTPRDFIDRLYEGKLVTRREARIMQAVMEEFDSLKEGELPGDLKRQFLLRMFEAVIKP